MRCLYEQIFDSSPQATLILNKEEQIHDVNLAAIELLSKDRGELVGHSFDDVFQKSDDDDQAGAPTLVLKSDHPSKQLNYEMERVTLGSDTFTLIRLGTQKDCDEQLRTDLASALIEETRSVMFAKTLEGVYMVGNKAWQDASNFGIRLEGKTDYDVFTPQIADRFRKSDETVLKSGRFETLLSPEENVYANSADDGKWYMIEKFPLYGKSGNVIGIGGVSTDVTELQQTNKRLKDANESLRKFSYLASHDLQEPLRKINTFGELLLEDHGPKLDSDGLHLVNVMRSAARRMSVLVKDLLEYSRTRNRQLERVSIALDKVLASLRSDYDLAIEEANVTLNVGSLPVVQADTTLVVALFSNLLSNAIKYRRPHQTPLIEISAQNENGSTQITVRDNGIGFDMALAHKIFDPFQRLHGTNEYSGSGIGLSLCEAAVERHGWRISVDSVPDEGTCFTIHIPQSDIVTP